MKETPLLDFFITQHQKGQKLHNTTSKGAKNKNKIIMLKNKKYICLSKKPQVWKESKLTIQFKENIAPKKNNHNGGLRLGFFFKLQNKNRHKRRIRLKA